MEAALWEARLGGHAVALLFCDLDGFKAVDDAHGHATGDELLVVLVVLAQRLREQVRRTDLLARLGEDEFLVALPGLDASSAAQDARRVADGIAEVLCRPVELGGRRVAVGASIGIGVHPGDGATFGELLHRADQRMYAVKRDRRTTRTHPGAPGGPPALPTTTHLAPIPR